MADKMLFKVTTKRVTYVVADSGTSAVAQAERPGVEWREVETSSDERVSIGEYEAARTFAHLSDEDLDTDRSRTFFEWPRREHGSWPVR